VSQVFVSDRKCDKIFRFLDENITRVASQAVQNKNNKHWFIIITKLCSLNGLKLDMVQMFTGTLVGFSLDHFCGGLSGTSLQNKASAQER